MFRLSRFMEELVRPTAPRPHQNPPGPVIVWNLVRRCNLNCLHCYSLSADRDFRGELTTAEVLRVLASLKAAKVPALVLSGGEPLLRPDLWTIAQRAKALGFYTALSTNGTRVDEATAARIAATGFDYVGVSLDGLKDTHDRFRRAPGAFDAALEGLRRLRDCGVRVGVRFTLARDNAADLAPLLDLCEREEIPRFYLSHFNYAGRGGRYRDRDAAHALTRAAMDLLFERAWEACRRGLGREYVTGNNDADGAYLLLWAAARQPGCAAHLRAKLEEWGGNASGVAIGNIDNLGNVHPDTMWWDVTLGSVRERSFAEIWADTTQPLMAGLKARPRPVKGRCAACRWLAICNGNTRVRALRVHGDPWAEDPGCYLSDAEIGVAAPAYV